MIDATLPRGSTTAQGRFHAKKLTHGHGLKVPDGRILDDLEGAEIVRLLSPLGVPGLSASQGREANAMAYEIFLTAMARDAGYRFVENWLHEQNGKKPGTN